MVMAVYLENMRLYFIYCCVPEGHGGLSRKYPVVLAVISAPENFPDSYNFDKLLKNSLLLSSCSKFY